MGRWHKPRTQRPESQALRWTRSVCNSEGHAGAAASGHSDGRRNLPQGNEHACTAMGGSRQGYEGRLRFWTSRHAERRVPRAGEPDMRACCTRQTKRHANVIEKRVCAVS
eukprot:6258527-Prymnesium_polylepis.1